jgi:hypothetical protein
MTATSLGPLVKAKENLKILAKNAPSARELLANRTQQFDRILAILDSTAQPGEELSLTVQIWDQCERLHRSFEGTIQVESTDPDAECPDTLSIDPGDDGILTDGTVSFATPGTQYLTFVVEGTGERFVSNPVRVATDHAHRVYWGDLHVHSVLSDGVGTPRRGYEFGRDVMDLDVVAYADHDTMGFFIPPKWQQRRMHDSSFDRLCGLADEFNDDGSFVTLPAYEWTKQPNVGGHINVYFEDSDDAELFDSLDPDSDSYERLWARLREWDREHDSRVVSIPHHPAEEMYPFDFASVDYDDDMAPLVEVYSQWGSSERQDDERNTFPIEMGQGGVGEDGYYVEDAHRLGYRVGMLGGADYHGPQPGHAMIHTRPHFPSFREWRQSGLGWGNIWRIWDEPSYPGGLTAFLAPELTREAIFSTLRSRSVYATTQPDRILVDFSINGVDVATQDEEVVLESEDASREVSVEVAGTEPLEQVVVTKNNEDWRTIEGTTDPSADLDAYTVAEEWTDEEPITGMSWDQQRGTDADVYTVRVDQASDRRYPGAAWVGPIWVRSE